MAYRRVSGPMKYFKYEECEDNEPLVVEGLYIGEKEGEYGIQHEFHQKDGQKITLNSAGHLNSLLSQYAEAGKTYCNIFYAGKRLIEKGKFEGKEAHNFILDIDDSVKQDMSPSKSVSDQALVL